MWHSRAAAAVAAQHERLAGGGGDDVDEEEVDDEADTVTDDEDEAPSDEVAPKQSISDVVSQLGKLGNASGERPLFRLAPTLIRGKKT